MTVIFVVIVVVGLCLVIFGASRSRKEQDECSELVFCSILWIFRSISIAILRLQLYVFKQ